MPLYTKKRLFAFVVLGSAATLIYFSLFPKSQNILVTPRSSVKKTENITKYILYWLPMWNSKTFSFGSEGFELFRHCEFKNCFATHNKHFISIEKFDAIVFHAAQYNEKKHGKPWKRRAHQRYIFANMEAPTRAYPANLRKLRSFYNWTMTYRYDSDIVRPYGYVIKNTTDYIMPSREFIRNKTKLVAWFVSNCHTINRREELYRNLRRFLKIDVYGSCGKMQCPKEFHESSSKCYDAIEKTYKFYLSFENTHCKDYVTEKFYRILQRNIVPVVYGNADYKKIAPPSSTVIASQYANARQLADYLLFLSENPKEYLKYFEWKRHFYIERDENKTVCKLCKMLHDPLEPSKTYKNIFEWWVGKNHSHCKLGNGLPNISIPIL